MHETAWPRPAETPNKASRISGAVHNDGAAAVVVGTRELAATAGVTPLATIRSRASVGGDPVEAGLARVPAIEKALGRAGLSVGDVDV